MKKKGLVQIITPTLPDSREIPTEDDPQKQNHARKKFHLPDPPPLLPKDKVKKADQERKDETDWSFGQSGEGHRHIKSVDKQIF